MPDRYVVVFEGTSGPNGSYTGIRSSVSFLSEDEFNEWKLQPQNSDVVVAEGVSNDEAVRLVGETSGRSRARAAFMEAHEEGLPLTYTLDKARAAAERTGRGVEFDDEVIKILGEGVGYPRQKAYIDAMNAADAADRGTPEPSRYTVVLEGTGAHNSGRAGIRTIKNFDNEAEFRTWKEDSDSGDIIIAEGVNSDEAQRLAAQATGAAWARAAWAEAGDPPDPMLLEIVLGQARMVAVSEGRQDDFDAELIVILNEQVAAMQRTVGEILETLDRL